MRSHVNTLQLNAQNVNFLIESMLSWVRSQGESFKVSKKDAKLQEVIDGILAELNVLLKVKCIEIKVENITDEVTLFTDYDLLKLVIRNILTNSIKYSEKQSEITIKYDRKKGHVIEIVDHGIGMDKETLHKIMSNASFSNLGTKNEKGTGMGLPLVFEMTRKLGGEITIDSAPNVGTSVTLLIP